MRAPRTCLLLVAPLFWACPPPKPDPKAQAEGLYLAGTAEFLQGNFEKAHAYFEQVRALQPDDARLPAAVGEVFFAQGKLSEALKAFETASALDPQRSTNWSRLGLVHSLKGNRAEAQRALHQAVGLNPKDFVAHEELAELAIKNAELERALQHFQRALGACPEPQRPRLYLRMAAELTKAGRPEEARGTLAGAVAAGVRSPELLSEWGELLVRAGKLKEAAKAYEEAATLSPRDPTLWELVGELQLRLDRPADAEAAFRESLRVKDRAVVHVALARLALRGQDPTGAKEALEKALQAATGEEVRETLELADLLGQMGRPKDGLFLLSGLGDEPELKADPDFHRRLASMAQRAGDAPAQKRACAALRALNPSVKRCP